MRVTLRWILLLGVVAVLETACGPIRSTSGVVYARQAIQEAETEGADSVALYEMTLAREYLRKAREEMGYNDYYMAEQLAIKAEEMADLALERTLGAAALAPVRTGGVEAPNIEDLPDWGELDPERRTGAEQEQEDLLDAEDPWGTYKPSTGSGEDEGESQ